MLLQHALRQLSHATASCSARCEASLVALLINSIRSLDSGAQEEFHWSSSRQLHALTPHAHPQHSAAAGAWAIQPFPSPRINTFPAALPLSAGPAHLFARRGYKSNKRTLKPLNTKASWLAVRPFLPPDSEFKTAVKSRYARAPIVDTCIPPIPEVPRPDVYKHVGMLTAPYKLRPEKVFAVVELAGTQWKVTTDDVLFVNQLPHVDVNDVISLERVLLLGSRAQTVIGRPYVPGSCVLAAVEEHFRDGKVHVFKKKPKKRYQRYAGPRPNLTTLRILQVRGIDPAPGDELALVDPLPIAYLEDMTRGSYSEAASLEVTTELLTGSSSDGSSDEDEAQEVDMAQDETHAGHSSSVAEVQREQEQHGEGGGTGSEWNEQLRALQQQVQAGSGPRAGGGGSSRSGGSAESGDGGADVVDGSGSSRQNGR